MADIRLLEQRDAEAFRDVRQRSLIEHPDAYTSTAEEWGTAIGTYHTRIAENRVIGAFVDGQLVGTVIVALTARSRQKQRHKTEFWSVYLAPEHRGTGIARKLLEYAVAEARRLGFEAALLTVVSHNAAAAALYESLGFVRYGLELRALKLPDGSYCDEILMQLEL